MGTLSIRKPSKRVEDLRARKGKKILATHNVEQEAAAKEDRKKKLAAALVIVNGLRRPFAIGIHKPRPDGITYRAWRTAFNRAVTSEKYLRALAAGGPRFDREGQPSGVVTPEQRKLAGGQLKALERQKAAYAEKQAERRKT